MKKLIIYLISALLVICSVAPSAVFAAGSNIDVTAKIEGSKLVISGTGCSSAVDTVGIKVLDPDDAVLNVNQIPANSDGSFSYFVDLGADGKAGTYKVIAADRAGNDQAEANYLSPAKVLEIETTVENATPETYVALGDYLYENRRVLGLNDGDVNNPKNLTRIEEYQRAAQVLINLSEVSTLSLSEIMDQGLFSKALWDTAVVNFNDLTYTTALAYNNQLLGDSAEYNSFTNFYKVDREAVVKAVKAQKPFADIFDFKAKFATAVTEFEKTMEKITVNADVTVDGDEIQIKGNSTLSLTKVVTVKVTDPDGTLVNVNQLRTENNGDFEYVITMPSSTKNGNYTVEIFGRGANDKKVVVVFFLSSKDRNDIADAIWGAADSAAIEAVLKTNAYNMQMEYLTDTDRANAALYLFEQKGNVKYTYKEILEKISDALNLIINLNLCEWTDADAFFADNSSTLFNADCDYDRYSNLEDIPRHTLCGVIMESAPFDTFEEFRGVFISQLNIAAPDTPDGGVQDNNGNNNNNGNNVNNGNNGNNGGGVGGGVTISYPEIGSTQTPPPADVERFNDLGNYSWAKESIMTLLAKGVVSPAADGKFRPADAISREEFVKLLVCAFNIPTSNKNSGFADVDPDAWYSPYISAAAEKGIVNGYDDKTFGIKQSISRQDMAVMILRCAQVCNVSLPNTYAQKNFIDAKAIADYSTEAVKQLQMSGIINGDENGNFRPIDNANRAEAAKMIAMLIKITL